jgi:hypothetical protein
MILEPLFAKLVNVFSGPQAIETHVRDALCNAQFGANLPTDVAPLPKPFLDAMSQANAHPICKMITQIPFNWAPPQTSNDPLYVEHSTSKVHVELLGPAGLVKSSTVRLGLYGMLPNSEYGLRTHPAEEIYIMLAGQADWKHSDAPYKPHYSGERSYHPSMMPHASRTGDLAFMSVYAWHGNISTENYLYQGLPIK